MSLAIAPSLDQAASAAAPPPGPVLPSVHTFRSRLAETCMHQVVGRVAGVSGGCVDLEGMTAPIGSICELTTSMQQKVMGQIIGFRGVRPILSLFDTMPSISAGDNVRLVESTLRLFVGASLCGRILDALGRPIDGRPLPANLTSVAANSEPPKSLERPPIDVPLSTGVRAIDAMLTCGKGQRLGIFAGSGVGKSTLMGMLARGSNADRIVIGMVGERGREVQEFIQRALGAAGLARSVVVVATSDRPASQRVAAAWTATAIAEKFRDEGQDVLLLLDSVTRFAMAQRELGLAAGEPPTTRGYPPSVFSLLPQLVERTGRTTKGSITAFYTVLVEGDDPNEPIADTLRGLLDGHLMLDRELATAGHYPPIDVLESLSRLQPHLASPGVRMAATIARGHLAVYRKNADLISIGAYRAGSDPKIDAAIAIRETINRLLIQDSEKLVPLDQSQAELQTIVGMGQASETPQTVGTAQTPGTPRPGTTR
jgi:flagellum-specific ATP synthase